MTMLSAAMTKMIVSPTEQRKRAEVLKRKFYWVEKLQPTPVEAIVVPLPPKPIPSPLITDDEYTARFLSIQPRILPKVVLNKVKTIQRTVAAMFKMEMVDMLSARKTKQIVFPRQIAMYLCKTNTTRSLPEIGRAFGGRDHTTVLHATRKIERLMADPINHQLRMDIAVLKVELSK